MNNRLSPVLSVCLAAAGIGLPTNQVATAFPPSDPDALGISPSALEALAHTVTSNSERDLIVGGSLLVIKNRRQVCFETCGWQDRERQIPFGTDTLCNIRSMTKMLTGAACQILIDAGVVRLDDRVAYYLPGFDTPQSRTITVEQLLTHRSGLPLTILTTVDEYPDLQAMAHAIGQRGPQFAPGARFWYSDAGTDSLGAVVEVASGMTLDRFVRTRLLEPLAMEDTWYLHEAAVPRSRIGSLYYGQAGAWTKIWTSDQPFYTYAWGSQSLYSTPADYARFLALLLDNGVANGERILSEAAVARILTPTSVMTSLGSPIPHPTGFPHTETHYGQMSILYQSGAGVEAFGHSGSDGTWAWAWPEQDLIILYFTQSRGQSSGIRLESDFDRWLLHPEAQPATAAVERYLPYLGWYQANFESALGTFREEAFGLVILNDRLGLDIPGQMIFQLQDASLTGRWYFAIERALSVAFEHDGSGTVTGLRFYEPDHVFRLPKRELSPRRAPRFLGAEGVAPQPDEPGPPWFRCWMEGTPDHRYQLESSANLVDWTPFQTVVLGGSRFEVIDDSLADSPRRFLRARVVPY